MQYPHTIELVYTTPDAYGKLIETTRATLKCLVIETHKVDVSYNSADVTNYSLNVVVPARAFAPYSDLLEDDNLRFEFNGKSYFIVWGSGYNKPTGVTKLYEFKLKLDKDSQ